ncbi:MAG: hypothetical protein QOH32_2414 [Bradyrhizobium sp.]|jgi:hypothetical protein|nr:hypothetical protein [Bradyrhizobium sp.]
MKQTRRVLAIFVAMYAVYLPIVWWLKTSYEPADIVIDLNRPYSKMVVDGFGFQSVTMSYKYLGDAPFAPTRSPMILYEDGKRQGPPHSSHEDISKLGLGRFSHWHDAGYIFSSSDNSDPNHNGRRYWAVLPKEVNR